MAYTVHKKILTSRSDYFRNMLAPALAPAPPNLSTALNGVIKSSIDSDTMSGIETSTPESQVKSEVEEDTKDTKPIVNDSTSTLSLPDDDVISVKSFIDWVYSGSVTMTPEKEIFHLTIYVFAEKVSEAYCNDFLDSYRAYYFNKSTYMNQSALRRMYSVGLRGSPLAKFGLKTIVYASMKWPKEWVKEDKKPKRGNSVTVVSADEEKESLQEWTNEPMLLLDYADEVIKWQKKAAGDPSATKGCVFHEHKRGTACKAAVELK